MAEIRARVGVAIDLLGLGVDSEPRRELILTRSVPDRDDFRRMLAVRAERVIIAGAVAAVLITISSQCFMAAARRPAPVVDSYYIDHDGH